MQKPDPQTTAARLEKILRKIVANVDEGDEGSRDYAHDRLDRIRALATYGADRVIGEATEEKPMTETITQGRRVKLMHPLPTVVICGAGPNGDLIVEVPVGTMGCVIKEKMHLYHVRFDNGLECWVDPTLVDAESNV